MSAYGLARVLSAMLAIAGAIAYFLLQPQDIYGPSCAVIAGSATFSGVLMGETLPSVQKGGALSAFGQIAVMAIMMAAFYAFVGVPAAWLIDSVFSPPPSAGAGLFMALPATLLGGIGAMVGWQQNRLELAAAKLAHSPSPQVASRLAERAQKWADEAKLEACDVLIEAGFPRNVEDVLSKRESFEDVMRARAATRLALARAERGDIVGARRALAEIHLGPPEKVQHRFDLANARILVAEDKLEEANELLGDGPPLDDYRSDQQPYISRIDRMIRARLFAANDQTKDARDALQAIRTDDGDRYLEALARGDDAVARLAHEMLHGSTGAPFR